MLDSVVLAVARKSPEVARKRAAALVNQALLDNSNLLERVAKCRSMVERGLSPSPIDKSKDGELVDRLCKGRHSEKEAEEEKKDDF